jgi:hypothetical protein
MKGICAGDIPNLAFLTQKIYGGTTIRRNAAMGATGDESIYSGFFRAHIKRPFCGATMFLSLRPFLERLPP